MELTIREYGKIKIKFPLSDAELAFELKRYGLEDKEPIYELHNVKEEGHPLSYFEGRQINLDEANFLEKRLLGMDEYERRVLKACMRFHPPKCVQDMINMTYSLKGLSVICDFSDAEAVGRRLYLDNETAFTETEIGQTDLTAYAEGILKNARKEVLLSGVYVEHDFAMVQMYNGYEFPLSTYDSDMSKAVVRIENENGGSAYLYLPTSKVSLDKVKERLGVECFSECLVTKVTSNSLPEKLLADISGISGIKGLEKFNCFCKSVAGPSSCEIKKLEMIAEYMGENWTKAMENVAAYSYEFDVIPEVLTDEEYGRYLVHRNGEPVISERIAAHIDYAGLSRTVREEDYAESGFTQSGFVGCRKSPEIYLGHCCGVMEPLEINPDEYKTFRLYSPLRAVVFAEGEMAGYLYGDDLAEYEEKISLNISQSHTPQEQTRGLMIYYHEDTELNENVLSAFPEVGSVGGRLYGVLECQCKKIPEGKELVRLMDFWTGQMSDGWGEGFEQRGLEVDIGEIYVSFYQDEDDWRIMTEEEVKTVHSYGMRSML